MRIVRDRLAFHAICVLAQAREDARVGRVQPNPSLRLALAVVAQLGGDAKLIDMLWEELTRRDECGDAPGAIGRAQVLNAALNGAVRAVGLESDPRLDAAIARAIRREDIREAPARD